jgi:uncharacterized protein YjbJ (UPF0337 family)
MTMLTLFRASTLLDGRLQKHYGYAKDKVKVKAEVDAWTGKL